MNPIASFLAALFGVALTLGAWLVRGVSRAGVTTMFGSWTRAECPGAYWFWTIYLVAGLASFCLALAAVTFYFVFVS